MAVQEMSYLRVILVSPAGIRQFINLAADHSHNVSPPASLYSWHARLQSSLTEKLNYWHQGCSLAPRHLSENGLYY